jgi:hypothetical protein
MSKQTRVQLIIAAIVVVVLGAILASAEERIEVRVEKESADEISVDINGVTEVIHLADLADGEERVFDVGDHELIVKRVGDDLTIVGDGQGFASLEKSLDTMVWVGDNGENVEIDGDREFGGKKVEKVIVMTSGDEEAGKAKTYTIRVDGDKVMVDGDDDVEIDEIMKLHGDGQHGAIFISEDGSVQHPEVVNWTGMNSDMVRYRCEESGSTLLVKAEDAIEDAYICPATGCVMTKVEEPEVHVIKIQKKVETED